MSSQPSFWVAFLRKHLSIILLTGMFGFMYASTVQSHGMFMWDEAEYASLSRSLLEGKGFTFNEHPNALRPPLLPLLGAAALLIGGNLDDRTLMIPVVMMALLGIGLVYAVVRRVYGADAALMSALILGASPAFWEYTSYFLTEVPFSACFSGAVLFMHLGLYRAEKFFAYSWACFGLALMTRYTALLFGPILVLMLAVALVASRKNREISARIFSRTFLVAPFAAALVVLPWLVKQYIVFGDVLVGFRIASGQLQAYLPRVSLPWWTYVVGLPDMMTWLGVGLLLAGLMRAVHKRDPLLIDCTLVALFFFVWFSVYRYKEIRLITGVLPFLSVIAGVGGAGLARRIFPKFNSWVRVGIVGLVMVIVSFSQTASHFRLSRTLGYPVFGQAMEYLRTNSSPNDVIMGASEPQISWYAGRRVVAFPSRENLLQGLDDADWVVIVNFERGQPKYVLDLATRIYALDIAPVEARIFQDRRYGALVARANLLRMRP